MPKQAFVNGTFQITEDTNDPEDRLKILAKQHKGKGPKTLTVQEKAALFDAYVDAGVIKL